MAESPVALDPAYFPDGADNAALLNGFLAENAGRAINWPAGVYVTHDRTLYPSGVKIYGALDDATGKPNCGTRVLTSEGGIADWSVQRTRSAWQLDGDADPCLFKQFEALGPKPVDAGRSPSAIDPATGKKYRNRWEGQAGFAHAGTHGHEFCEVWSSLHWGDGFGIGGEGSGVDVENSGDLVYRYCKANNVGRMAWLLSGVSSVRISYWEAERYASGCFHTEMSANPYQDQADWLIERGHDHGGGPFFHCSSGQELAAVQIVDNLIDDQFQFFAAGRWQPDGTRGYKHWVVSRNAWTKPMPSMNIAAIDGFLFQGNVGEILRGRPWFNPDNLPSCANVRALRSENSITVAAA